MALNIKDALEIVKRAGFDSRATINASDREPRPPHLAENPALDDDLSSADSAFVLKAEQEAHRHAHPEALTPDELFDIENL